MAIAVVNKKQTPSTASATLTITSATAGNLLVMFIAQTASVSAPTGKDNKGGSWTVNATKALNTASANSLWVATKVAEGGETLLEPTVGAGGKLEGLCYFELSGASATVDVINNKDNVTGVKTVTSNAITTTDAGDIVLAAISSAATNTTGTISAWTGTGPMANVETVSTRCMGGSYIPGTTLAAVTFTANWETAKAVGMLVVAFKPEASESRKVAISGGIKLSGVMAVIEGLRPAVKGSIIFTDTATPVLGVRPVVSGGVRFTGTAVAIEGLRPTVSGSVRFAGAVIPITGVRPAASSGVVFTTHATAAVGTGLHPAVAGGVKFGGTITPKLGLRPAVSAKITFGAAVKSAQGLRPAVSSTVRFGSSVMVHIASETTIPAQGVPTRTLQPLDGTRTLPPRESTRASAPQEGTRVTVR